MSDDPEEVGVPDEVLTKMGLPMREEMQEWLDENTTSFSPEKSVTLHSFDVNWPYLKGDCLVKADDRAGSTTIHFYYDLVAWPLWRGSVFHSPLGVPASFPSVEFSEDATEAITRGLQELLPRIKPVGRDDDGSMISFSDSMATRLPPGFDTEALRRKLDDSSFELRIEVQQPGQ